jgi:hypothetical protein
MPFLQKSVFMERLNLVSSMRSSRKFDIKRGAQINKHVVFLISLHSARYNNQVRVLLLAESEALTHFVVS